MAKNDFIFFWNGIYSQWHPSKFIIEGVEYNCCEQYMMAKKALLFGDEESHKMIMASDNPRDQKAFGRRVKGFDTDKWNAVCREYVYEGNLAKFTQIASFKEQLLATGTKEIAEASPVDNIWGIGLAENDSRAWDKSTWEGTNWLGEAIMKVRLFLWLSETK